MKRTISIFALASVAASSFANILVHDNGDFITGSATTGEMVSMRNPGSSVTGWGAQIVPSGSNFVKDSVADDFTINSMSGSEKLSFLRLYLYEGPFNYNGNYNLSITDIFINIWAAAPTTTRYNEPETIVWGNMPTAVATSIPTNGLKPLNVGGTVGTSTPASGFTGVFRVPVSGTDPTTLTSVDKQRPIMQVDVDLSSVPTLNNGTYWLEVATLGSNTGTQAWVPTNYGSGPTGTENGRELDNGTWRDTLGWSSGDLKAQDFGFEVYAVPEPATLAALGLGALALIRRRRSK